jgi:hypothetical protein
MKMKKTAKMEITKIWGEESYCIQTPLVITAKGITFSRVLESSGLTKKEQHKIGWKMYKATSEAVEKIKSTYIL